MLDFNKQMNTYATIREYLMTTLTNLPIIPTAKGIILQASTISQLTQSTNQLTRLISVLVRIALFYSVNYSFSYVTM